MGGRDLRLALQGVRKDKSFNSRARGRARRPQSQFYQRQSFVSTHAPVGGRDAPSEPPSGRRSTFQLTRPWEGATQDWMPNELPWNVSTHAPVGGRDDHAFVQFGQLAGFQLTRPWEGATVLRRSAATRKRVSTHAPVGGRDHQLLKLFLLAPCFNSRARGRARHVSSSSTSGIHVSTHAPVGGRDIETPLITFLIALCFNSRARGRARPEIIFQAVAAESFNSRARGRARPYLVSLSSPPMMFQLTRPWEGATHVRQPAMVVYSTFQLTRPWEGATSLRVMPTPI